MRPNLFDFATSELSQDAVLCWFLAWSGKENAGEDGLLHRLGQRFLELLLNKHGKVVPIVERIEVLKQLDHIDVLAIINGTLALCIEDKVGSEEHSDQLPRYLSCLQERGYTKESIVPIYIQTMEQPSFEAVKEAGYAVVRRREIIELLRNYMEEGGRNAIATDLHERLYRLEEDFNSFRTKPLNDWSPLAWQGFYSTLQDEFGDGQWGYVSNKTGGFYGYWWHFLGNDACEQYCQLEQQTLCFKISVGKSSNRVELRSTWFERILAADWPRGFSIVKPERFGSGATMTIAVLSGEYRAVNEKDCFKWTLL
jgi:hypothetical protein